MSEKPKHIVIVTGQHMVANPRVWKEANTLAEHGYRVTILTTFYDAVKKELDKELLHPSIQYKASVNLIKEEGSVTDVYFSRIWRRIALYLKKTGKIDKAGLILYRLSKQVKLADAEDADLYIAHQEAGLLIGNELIKKGKKVAFDLEDWYSRDYINELRPVQLLKSAEAFALLNAVYITCPSESMANAMMTAYHAPKKPISIYNSFSLKENDGIVYEVANPVSLIWFSQVVGPGRGLENLIKALRLIKRPLEIHLVGNVVNGYENQLNEEFKKMGHLLFFHGIVKHHELLPLIAQFNIGLALENNIPDNKDTTVSNKILQYIQAGNKVLATNTKGQLEIAAAFPDSVCIVEVDQPEQWAGAIEELLDNTDNRKGEQLSIFRKQYCWEAQEEKLTAQVKESIG